MKSKIKFPFLYSIATACLVAMAALISSGCDGDSDNDSFSGPSGEGNAGIVISNETLEFLNAAVNGTGFILAPVQLTNVNTMVSITTNGMLVTTNLVNTASTNAINNVIANTFAATAEVGRRGSASFNVPAGSYSIKITQVVRDPRETGLSYSGSTTVSEGQTATFTVTEVTESGISVTE